MNKKIRAMVVAALTVASVFAFSASAQAGQYNVSIPACSVFNGTPSWSAGGNGWVSAVGCNGSMYWFMPYPGLTTPSGAGIGAAGNYMWHKSAELPSGTYMKSIAFSYLGASTGSNPIGGVRGCFRTSGGNPAYAAAINGNCIGDFPGGQSLAHTGANWTGAGASFTGTNYSAISLDNASAPGPNWWIWMTNFSAVVGDDTAPTVTSQLATHEISQGGWLNGAVETGSTGTDASGIKSNAFYPGVPNLTITAPASCSYAQWIPCTNSVGHTTSFDTAGVSDGAHTGYYTAIDAADNAGQSASFSYKVDNTEPTTPSSIDAATNGTNGWSSTNSVGASWTNGAEVAENATQSGLDQVIVDVNPTEGAQSNPAPVAVPVGGSASGVSATSSSISGLALPAAGAWTLRLQLVDKAGNVSDVGDGSGASADSDISVGYDPNPPATPQGQANGWISRDELAAGYDQDFSYTPLITSIAPVCGFASTTNKNVNGVAGSTINIPGGGTRKVRLDGTLDEDTHYVHIRAVACNGVASPTTNSTEAKVDRTDAVGTISGVENGKWYKNGQLVELHGSDVLSGMAPAPADKDDSRLGAYLAYSINSVGPVDKEAPRGDTTSIPITGEGQKALSFSPVDLAGNKAPAKVATFGIDATNPTGYVNQQDSARPTLLSAKLADAPSGVSYAIFSVRPVGGSDNDWIQLPTSLAGVDGNVVGAAVASGTATARFPDTSLAQGTYDVRVAAFDQAGNPISTQRYQDGSLARVENPMRAATGVSVKLFKALRECKKNKTGKMKCAIKKCTKKTKGTCYKVLKGKVVLQGGSTTVTSAYNRGAIATGVLTDASGAALKNTDVTLSTTTKVSGKPAEVGVATSDANGIWAIRVPAGVNRAVKATYEGTELRRPASSIATLNTQAKLKLKVSNKGPKTGQSITFSGTVTPFDATYPSGGKIVALQFFAAKKWRPAVGVGHTDKNGKFKIKYKFDGRKVKAKIIFRIVAPSEDAWGHAYSVSKPVNIKLNY